MRGAADLNNAGRDVLGGAGERAVLRRHATLALWRTDLMADSLNTIQCRLQGFATSLLGCHYGLLYGEDKGFKDIPEERNLPYITADYDCSPFTRDDDQLKASMAMTGTAELWTDLTRVYFADNCLTDLELADSAIVNSNERASFFTRPLDRSKCVFYHSGDRQARRGLHRLLEDYLTHTLALSATPLGVRRGCLVMSCSGRSSATPRWDDPSFEFATRYMMRTSELKLGIIKVMIW
eukprot:CAMPEP_0175862552 /NCGR_PEP_ID=MMETSP0107_2-20121207/32007_1 /TAXON_ID=195067 ORGANISM="Goniomonas pacifica, Strain CCMP1869" /NCGR_SAMPLE_ID=MMETSP0107_2 /ASSEMBLY_ACC=CAM_ASM_000203 /LENGTH=236 /DNA_ID=CAMNT_0017179561 /DNA_START=105 /DNA_END=813 /DNA_ORIENTATION=-